MTTLSPQQQGALCTPDVRRLMHAIKDAGGEARIVGGAVRDVLLGQPPGDIDLATTLVPEAAIAALTKANIKTVPTGMAHGTITAVLNHVGYEITTLRQDVETDGRHATVAYTNNWQADAARRDFTINALYMDEGGTLYDYFGGQADAEKGIVRFIGMADDRIKEDVLRILRFFRFYAWFGKGNADKGALAACQKLAGLIPTLSVERVWREMQKLLLAPNPLPALRLMLNAGLLEKAFPPHVLAGEGQFKMLGQLIDAENECRMPPSALIRLATFIEKTGDNPGVIARHLKFSNRDAERFTIIGHLPPLLEQQLDTTPLRRMLYRHGVDACRDSILLIMASRTEKSARAQCMTALDAALAWEHPDFPVHGQDLIKLGIKPGPEMGALLRQIETWWIERDFRPTRQECLDQARRHANKQG